MSSKLKLFTKENLHLLHAKKIIDVQSENEIDVHDREVQSITEIFANYISRMNVVFVVQKSFIDKANSNVSPTYSTLAGDNKPDANFHYLEYLIDGTCDLKTGCDFYIDEKNQECVVWCYGQFYKDTKTQEHGTVETILRIARLDEDFISEIFDGNGESKGSITNSRLEDAFTSHASTDISDLFSHLKSL